MRLKKTMFWTFDEEKDVKRWIKQLIEKGLKPNSAIGSGGFEIRVEYIDKENNECLFSLNRCVGNVLVKLKKQDLEEKTK